MQNKPCIINASMKRNIFSAILLFLSVLLYAQPVRPKLAVGIVVDQMRPEYLYRFSSGFGNNGFNRLVNEGFVCYNTHINYLPTVTGAGHASIYTGTTPKFNGILGNYWFDRNLHKVVYCAKDAQVETVGNDKKEKGGYSARNVMVPTIGDVLKLTTNKQGKVYAISLKDRSSAFPAGHAADGAFWFDKKTGNFVSSTYYMNTLPEWLTKFNRLKKADSYLDSIWKPIGKPDDYLLSWPDSTSIRYGNKKGFINNSQKKLRDTNTPAEDLYAPIYASPFGNKLLADAAIEIIKNADLGKDAIPDLLAISFSSTDVVGHGFGPLSKELNDTYIRLDAELGRVLNALDTYVGKGNYVLFLTADHGMSDIPALLTDNKIPGGYLDDQKLRTQLDSALTKHFGTGNWIDTVYDEHVYLRRPYLENRAINLTEAQNVVAEFLHKKDGIADALTAHELANNDYVNAITGRIQNGFFFNRGGDVRFALMPGWMMASEKKEEMATHGSGFNSDTNIPLIWYGSGIKHGRSYIHYNITDIAPTVSALLQIINPTAATGNPIPEVLP